MGELCFMFIVLLVVLCVCIIVNQYSIICNQKYIIRLNQKTLQEIKELNDE